MILRLIHKLPDLHIQCELVRKKATFVNLIYSGKDEAK